MPQPFTTPNGFGYTNTATSVAAARPDCAAAIGMIAMEWTCVERQVNSAISGILGRTSGGDGEGWGINPNWIVEAAMSQVETNRSRINVANAIIGPLLDGHPLKDAWVEITGRLFKRARERNDAVHTNWGWSEQKPECLIDPGEPGPKITLWTLADFHEAHARIRQLNEDVRVFMVSVLEAMHAGEITNRVTPEMLMRR